MMITEKVAIEVDETKDIICDCCGKSCCVDEYTDEQGNKIKQFEYMKMEAIWGYFSKKDNTTYKAQICETCVDEVLKPLIKFEIIDENYPDNAMTLEECIERDRRLAENRNPETDIEEMPLEQQLDFSQEDAELIGVSLQLLMKWQNVFIRLFEELNNTGNQPILGSSEIIIGLYKIGLYFEGKENIRVSVQVLIEHDIKGLYEPKELISFQHINEEITISTIFKNIGNN
jgi:hypothetical protein